ncbi:MAG: hypothetical protein V3W18_07935 [candidate division Zixibacteria bacterium]
MKKNLIIGLTGVLLMCSTALGQFQDDPFAVYEAYTENGILPGGRAAAMGGAQIAAGSDGSVLWYNPALLTRIRMTEISGTLIHQKLTNETSMIGGTRQETNLNNTKLGSLWGVFPLATYRGGMTLGLSLNRIKSFDRVFRYATSDAWLDRPGSTDGFGGGEDESGNLWAFTLGGAVEVSPKASVGLSIDIFDGGDNWTYFFDSTAVADGLRYSYLHTIDDSYSGVTGKIGLSYAVNNNLNLSGIIGFPSSITIDQTSDVFEADNQGFDDKYHSSASYSYRLPFWLGAGAAIRHKGLTITGDFTYTDYSQLEYSSGLIDMARLNQLVRENYTDIFTYRIGGEYRLEPAGVRLRAGYYQEPIGFTYLPIETEPHFYTFGIGFVIDRAVNLDLAFLTGSWERDDPLVGVLEKYDVNRFMVTVSYRM